MTHTVLMAIYQVNLVSQLPLVILNHPTHLQYMNSSVDMVSFTQWVKLGKRDSFTHH